MKRLIFLHFIAEVVVNGCCFNGQFLRNLGKHLLELLLEQCIDPLLTLRGIRRREMGNINRAVFDQCIVYIVNWNRNGIRIGKC